MDEYSNRMCLIQLQLHEHLYMNIPTKERNTILWSRVTIPEYNSSTVGLYMWACNRSINRETICHKELPNSKNTVGSIQQKPAGADYIPHLIENKVQ